MEGTFLSIGLLTSTVFLKKIFFSNYFYGRKAQTYRGQQENSEQKLANRNHLPFVSMLLLYIHSSAVSNIFYLFIYFDNYPHMWHSVGKGIIWSFLETEILRKLGEMIKKSQEKRFSFFWRVRPTETPLCWQKTKKITPRLNFSLNFTWQ